MNTTTQRKRRSRTGYRFSFYSIRRTKRTRYCDDCSRIILRGESYLSAVGAVDGDFYAQGYCERCSKRDSGHWPSILQWRLAESMPKRVRRSRVKQKAAERLAKALENPETPGALVWKAMTGTTATCAIAAAESALLAVGGEGGEGR